MSESSTPVRRLRWYHLITPQAVGQGVPAVLLLGLSLVWAATGRLQGGTAQVQAWLSDFTGLNLILDFSNLLILGMAVGALAALRQYSVFDYIATTLAFLLFSMPIFCVAIVLENYGIEFNNVLQSVGLPRWLTLAGPPTAGFTGNIGQQIYAYTGTFILPTISIMVISFAAYSRFQRASMLEVLGADYVRTARAKGLSSGRVVFRHAFRNALIPVTTLFSLNFGAAFTGAIVTETVFAWPGMGSVLVSAVRQYDPNMLMGFLVVTATLIIIFNLIADITYGILDPRIRLG